MLFQEIIRHKRDGAELSAAEIKAMVEGIASGSASEGQVAAFAMAVRLLEETLVVWGGEFGRTPGELTLGVAAALYSTQLWPVLADGLFLAETQQDGSLLQVLADTYLGRQPDGTYDNSQISGLVINCADDPRRPLREFGPALFQALESHPVDRFVLDVRHNSGGQTQINGVFRDLAERLADGRVRQAFVITGRRTFSACQNLVNELHTYTNAIFVVEPTGRRP